MITEIITGLHLEEKDPCKKKRQFQSFAEIVDGKLMKTTYHTKPQPCTTMKLIVTSTNKTTGVKGITIKIKYPIEYKEIKDEQVFKVYFVYM